jgi:hypothetical protein
MNQNSTIETIKQLISDAEPESAMHTAREALLPTQNDALLLQLDLIESEYNIIKNQRLSGVLSVDDQIRYANITNAKLFELVELMENPEEAKAMMAHKEKAEKDLANQKSNAHLNTTFKNGFKNTVAALLGLVAIGSLMNDDVLAGVFILLATIITFVPTLQLIERFFGFEVQSWQKYVIVIGSLFAYGHFTKTVPSTSPVDKTIVVPK